MARLTLALILAASAAQADEAALRRLEESQQQIHAHMMEAARRITRQAVGEAGSRERWEPVKEQRRRELRDMLGLDPWPERTPLNVQITGRLEREEYVVEKLAFESLPKIYVTANLYIPQKREGRLPAVVYVCGHAYSPHGSKAYYQRHGISLAKNGYVAIILDPIQIAETFGLHHGVFGQEMPDWYSRGYTPAGVEVWNAIRAIDYLETRPEVDRERIGMTGRSGGAAMTWFTAAVDTRVKVAVPVMGISTYAANLKHNTQKLHCDCMFPVNGRMHDMIHQGALIAPRPLHMMHGRRDALFPVEGYQEFEQVVGGLYTSYDRRPLFAHTEVDTGHEDSDFLREQAIRWFDRHLLGRADRTLDMSYRNEDGAALAVFPDGPPADAANYRVHETFLPVPEFRAFGSREEWETRRSGLLEALRSGVFGAFPEPGAPLDLERGSTAQGGWEEVSFDSEPGIRVQARYHRPPRAEGALPLLVYVASEGEDLDAVNRFLRSTRRDRVAKLVVYPRGVGELAWTKTARQHALRNAMHIGQTLDSMRLWDTLRAVEAAHAIDGVDASRITVAGMGDVAVLALYAGALDARVAQAVLVDPPESHVRGPVFLNVLRHLDLPEAAALMAPRRLLFYGRLPEAYEAVRRVYELYGAGERVSVTMTPLGAAEGLYDHRFASGY